MATFTDDFNRADTGTNGGLGSNWTTMHGALEILSNKAHTSTTGTNCALYVATGTATFSADQEAQIVVSTLSSSDRVSPMVRCGSSTGYSLFCDGQTGSANRRITKITSSTGFTTIGTVDIVPANGDTVKIKAVGTTIYAYINGSLIDSVTDSSYSSGQPGIMYRRSGTGGSKIDDFSAADIATALSITSIVPTSFDSGKSVTVNGSGFGSSQGSSTLTIGGEAQTVTSWSDGQIVFTSVRGSASMGATKVRLVKA